MSVLTFEMMNENMESAFEELERLALATERAKRQVNVLKYISSFEPNYHCSKDRIATGNHCFNCVRRTHCSIFDASDCEEEFDAPICRYYAKELE